MRRRLLSLVTLLLLLVSALPGWARGPKKGQDLNAVLQLSDRARAKLSPRIKQQAIRRFGLKNMALRRSFLKRHNTHYRVQIPGAAEACRIRDQQASGRCWIFATDRVLQSKVQRKHKGTAPQLSTAFVNYHALRRQAFAVLDAAKKGQQMNPRDVQDASEGGFQPWATEIVRRHGFVPESKMPSGHDANHSGVYVGQLQALLATAQRSLRRIPAGKEGDAARKATVRQYKKQVDTLLSTALGKPPKRFRLGGQRYTPRTFLSRGLGLTDKDLDLVVLANDPSCGFNKAEDVSIPGFNDFKVYNVSKKTMKNAVKRTLRQGEAVYFASNVSGHPYSWHTPAGLDSAKGLLSISAYDYASYMPSDTRLSKRDRIKAGLGTANHAMAFVGYDTGAIKGKAGRGKVRKWKVQNSWGTSAGDGGYFHMYDDYFDQYVERVAVPRSSLPKSVQRQLAQMN